MTNIGWAVKEVERLKECDEECNVTPVKFNRDFEGVVKRKKVFSIPSGAEAVILNVRSFEFGRLSRNFIRTENQKDFLECDNDGEDLWFAVDRLDEEDDKEED
jgi:hypothetical protein